MSKLEAIKRIYNIDGFIGVFTLLQTTIQKHFTNHLKNEWSIRSLVNLDMLGFETTYGYHFDIFNPISFTEKIHTYKLLYDDPTMSEIVDKYSFKEYISRSLGSNKYVANAYGVYDSIKQIEKDWAILPNEFVLKSTISSDGNNIIFIKDKARTSFESIREDLIKCFNPKCTQLNGFARAYYSLKPRVVAEEYLHELDGGDLIDYKFYCFNGNIEFVYTTSRLFESKENPSDADYPRTFFNLNWEKIEVALGHHPTADGIPKPKHFKEMIEIAKKLSKGYPFVRVDFYDMKEIPLLGEMTFYPTGGWKTLTPIEYDRKLGEKFILPTEKLIKM